MAAKGLLNGVGCFETEPTKSEGQGFGRLQHTVGMYMSGAIPKFDGPKERDDGRHVLASTAGNINRRELRCSPSPSASYWRVEKQGELLFCGLSTTAHIGDKSGERGERRSER